MPRQELELALDVAADVADAGELARPDGPRGLEREVWVLVCYHAREILRPAGTMDGQHQV